MMETKIATVVGVISCVHGLIELEVVLDGMTRRAVAYQDSVGRVSVGDRVVINTTASSLALGSGGRDFVMVNLDHPEMSLNGRGHIMKMRYTPWQSRVLSVEEEDSPYRPLMESVSGLDGTPVLVATLHSMLQPLCACLTLKGKKVAYVMTDGASLPAAWSNTIHQLKEADMIAGVVTAGNAWGGDLEAVNVFSGLLAAHAVWKPDAILVAMGPGIVGTGTKWGFSGIEQGVILNAVDTLKGCPVAVPRISFADLRQRHQGISHHTLTVLGEVCKARTYLPLPLLEGREAAVLHEQVRKNRLDELHEVRFCEGSLVGDAIRKYSLSTTTMGRTFDQDPAFFLALGAAAELTLSLL